MSTSRGAGATASTSVTRSVERVVVCEPRGFCAGVEMAIKALAWMLRIYGSPVYCYHEIVHNRWVVEAFERAGVVFVEDPDDVPPRAPLMLSAHGSAPDVVDHARRHDRLVVDAVCPLVTKVHHEARTRARKGFDVIYVGHEGHDEAVGTMAEAPESMHLVQSIEDVVDLPFTSDDAVALLAQTTLAHSEWSGILDEARGRYPSLWTPGRSDLCFATTNRQAAVRAIASDVDMFLIIGSENSSNTTALVRVAAESGCPTAVRIEGPGDITPGLLGNARTVAITAGASAAESVVESVVHAIGPAATESMRITDEDEYFPLPRELREVIRAVDAWVGLSLGRLTSPGGVDASDRSATAADALEGLSSL